MPLRLITGDWQLESRPPCDRKTALGTSIRFKENQDVIQKMMEQAYKMGCRAMDHLGDMSEEVDPDSAVMTAAATLFRNAFDLGYDEIVGVPGNHDGALFDISSSSMAPFTALHERIFFYHEPHWHGNRLYLPYLHEKTPEQLGAILAEACEEQSGWKLPKNPILMAHYAYTGCTIGAKNLILPGDYLGRGQIPAAFKLAFFAHIHKQQVIKDKDLTVAFAGSPVICDHGERDDPKGFIVLNDEKNTYEMVQIKPTRRWVEATWPIYVPKEGVAQPWLDTDIVKIIGIRDQDTNVRSFLQAGFKKGLTEPFYWRDTTTLAVQERLVRSEDVAGAEDLRGSVVAFFDKQWPDKTETREKALQMVLGALKEANPETYSTVIVPDEIEGTDWMSWPHFKYKFKQGVPVLMQAPNGRGKTNFLEAFLFACTGMTSKKVKNSTLVRQGAKSNEVKLKLKGDRADFIITRTIKLSKTGSPTHKVKLEMLKHGETVWKSLADGGVSDTQNVLRLVIGASYESLRATRFAFQKDLSPFLGASVSERKEVLGEIIGLDPIARVFETIKDNKNAVLKLFNDAKASLAGMLSIFDPAAIGLAETAKAEAEKALLNASAQEKAARAVLVTAGQKADIARGNVGELERGLEAIPNVAAEVATHEQALASQQSAFTESQQALSTRYTASDAKVKALEAKKSDHALTAAKSLTADLQTSATTTKAALEAATKAETEMALSNAGVNSSVAAKQQALDTLVSTYTQTRDALALRYTAADKKVKDMKSKGLGSPEKLKNVLNDATVLEKVAAQCTEGATAAGAVVSTATTDLATAEAALKSSRDRIAELQSAETGNCSLCGQELNTAHIAKELATLVPLEKTQVAAVEAFKTAKAQAELTASAAQHADKVAAEALTTHRSTITALERDVKDLATAESDLLSIGTEGKEFKKNHETSKGTLTGELEALLKQQANANALLAPLTEAVKVAKSAEEVAAKALTDHMAALLVLEQEVKDLSAAKLDKDAITKEASDLKVTHDKKVLELTATLEAKRKEAGEWEGKKADLETRLKAAREALSGVEKDEATAKASLESVDQVVTLATKNKTDAESRLLGLRESEKKVLELTGTSETLQEESAVLTMAAESLNPRTGLPVFLIDAKLSFLESRANFYLAKMGSSRLNIRLTTLDGEKETLAIMVDNGNLPELEINAYSGGQWDRFEMSFKRALTELAETTLPVRLGFLGWDEPGVYLDDIGKATLVEIAHEQAANGESPVGIIISNDRQISSSFSHKVHLGEDEQGGTTFA
jgi:DNA repair exonuclease SbcCD ATPase subunit/predicted phosphodiesterase